MASKGVGPLPRMRGSALAHGCDRDGRAVLPLPRAAAVSAGLRVRQPVGVEAARRPTEDEGRPVLAEAARHVHLARPRVGFGSGLGSGCGCGLGLSGSG